MSNLKITKVIGSIKESGDCMTVELTNGWWLDIVNFIGEASDEFEIGLQHNDIEFGEIWPVGGTHHIGEYGAQSPEELVQILIDLGIMDGAITEYVTSEMDIDEFREFRNEYPWIDKYVAEDDFC